MACNKYTKKKGGNSSSGSKNSKKTKKITPSDNIIKSSPMNEKRYNEELIDLMEKLATLMLKQGEPFRARAYQKAQETIMMYPDDITNAKQLQGKSGIGSTIMVKITEYMKTGTLPILEREKNNPINLLTEVYGIGPKKAKELVGDGITTLEQLREQQDAVLNKVQKVGLQYFDDIQKRIPRDEIDEYKDIFEQVFSSLPEHEKSKFEIVGSYRRGVKSSGDIDVIVTSPTDAIFKKFIDKLIEDKIIIEVLSRGNTKSLVIAKLPHSNTARRVDFLYSTPDEYPFSILYFTGSKIFNTVMRGRALKLGYSLNEHGLHSMDGKKKGNKIDKTFKNEKEIFDFLDLKYQEPSERKDGRAIIILDKKHSPSPVKPADDKPIEKVSPAPEVKEKSPHHSPKNIIVSEEKIMTEQPKTEPEEKPVKKRGRPKKTDTVKITVKSVKKTTLKKKATPAYVSTPANNRELMEQFKKEGLSFIQQLSEKQLTAMIEEANKQFHTNEVPTLTDNEYDILKEYSEDKYPKNKVIKQIGAPIAEGKKVKLPYEMWSMDKIKPDTAHLDNWMKKYSGPYVISGKLDGVSGLYSTEKGKKKLYTRGNGKVGQDISHLIPLLNLPQVDNLVVRGEFIIPKKLFEEKYSKDFANPRNLVAGIVNRISIDEEKVKDIQFVAYEVIVPQATPSQQMELLKDNGFQVVIYEIMPSISNEILSQLLVSWRENYLYEIDGIIVTDDKIYSRKSGNPEHSFAFKMVLSDQIAEAKVVDVIWTASKDGYLKPRVRIEPIKLGGVVIEYATGFNAAFIENNKIGVGAIIELIRSGDVIPYIRNIITPAEKPLMPSVPYKWNDTHIDIILEDFQSNIDVREKNITAFFKSLGVDGLGEGNVKRIVSKGFDTIPKIIKMNKDDFLHIEGFKEKMANKIYDGIKEKLKDVSLSQLMSASNLFGRGFSDKKIELILQEYPDILTSTTPENEKIERVANIKGMAKKTAQLFVQNIPLFLTFLMETDLASKLHQQPPQEKNVDTSHPLYGKNIIMTGTRDKEAIAFIQSVGAKLGNSVSKNTFIVIAKNKDDDTGKVLDAKKNNIPVMEISEFLKTYS